VSTGWVTDPVVQYVATVLYQQNKGGVDGAGIRQMIFMKELLGPLKIAQYKHEPAEMTLCHVLACRGQFELEAE
jgi:hypothetical protein